MIDPATLSRCLAVIEQLSDQTNVDTTELQQALRAAQAAALAPVSTGPHPDEPHEFRTVCQRCGEHGYLHVAVITDLEVVKVEPRENTDV